MVFSDGMPADLYMKGMCTSMAIVVKMCRSRFFKNIGLVLVLSVHVLAMFVLLVCMPLCIRVYHTIIMIVFRVDTQTIATPRGLSRSMTSPGNTGMCFVPDLPLS